MDYLWRRNFLVHQYMNATDKEQEIAPVSCSAVFVISLRTILRRMELNLAQTLALNAG
jgi:hypothetical protein